MGDHKVAGVLRAAGLPRRGRPCRRSLVGLLEVAFGLRSHDDSSGRLLSGHLAHRPALSEDAVGGYAWGTPRAYHRELVLDVLRMVHASSDEGGDALGDAHDGHGNHCDEETIVTRILIAVPVSVFSGLKVYLLDKLADSLQRGEATQQAIVNGDPGHRSARGLRLGELLRGCRELHWRPLRGPAPAVELGALALHLRAGGPSILALHCTRHRGAPRASEGRTWQYPQEFVAGHAVERVLRGRGLRLRWCGR